MPEDGGGRESGRTTFDSPLLATYHAPAMANPLFDQCSPVEMANRSESIVFKGKIGDLTRLAEIVSADLAAANEPSSIKGWRDAPVEIELAFAWFEGQTEIPAVSGRATAQVTSICQRCLEVFEYRLESPIRWLLGELDDTELESLALTDFEAWELSSDTVRSLDLVEESLVMALPFAPVHTEDSSCKALLGSAKQVAPEMIRPFADLRSKMGKLDT